MQDNKENESENGNNEIKITSNWDYFFESVEVSDEFMNERNQPMPQERDLIFD